MPDESLVVLGFVGFHLDDRVELLPCADPRIVIIVSIADELHGFAQRRAVLECFCRGGRCHFAKVLDFVRGVVGMLVLVGPGKTGARFGEFRILLQQVLVDRDCFADLPPRSVRVGTRFDVMARGEVTA